VRCIKERFIAYPIKFLVQKNRLRALPQAGFYVSKPG
jgi:hypothetical protein